MRLAPGRSPRHRLLVLFLATTLLPSGALAWLGWQLVEQDRQLERQRVHDALEAAAGATAAGIERELSSLDRNLASLLETGLGPIPPGAAVIVRFTASGVAASAGAPLLYRPMPPQAGVTVAPEIWSEGERLEFVQKDLPGAIRAFRRLVQSGNHGIRAGALLRLARALKKTDRHDEALSVYATMAALTGAVVDGDPVDLIARRARIDLLDRIHRGAELRAEATSLARDLSAGRWPLDRTTYRAYAQDLRRWADPTSSPSAHALALTEAVSIAWEDWRARGSTDRMNSGRRTTRVDALPLLEVWRKDTDGLLFFAATPDYLTTAFRSVWTLDGFSVSLLDDGGNAVIETAAAGSAHTTSRAASDTRLPWTLRVSAATTPEAIAAAGRMRRQLLLAGLAMLTMLVAATGYLVNRAVRRELAVAKQQADFVSAVSHEFRSPLTSLTHLISLLRGEFQPTDDRRQQYYDVLERETDRLRRFVETLLDFGRMQAGAARFRLTPLTPAPVIHQIVEEFRKDPAAGSHPVTFEGDGLLPSVTADAEALGRAVWNLLENAAKYSPGDAPIAVRLERDANAVAIRVSDRGLGIPLHEQPHVFEQFFRGEAASTSAIKGTGVGLAVVHHIVRAHGGEIRLESEPGAGSTFSILLPAGEATSDESSRRAS
jgi:signal transduction histidine kinase